jgi:hypothetical protein
LTLIHLSGVNDPRVCMPAERTPHPPITFPSVPVVPEDLRAPTGPDTATRGVNLVIDLWISGG